MAVTIDVDRVLTQPMVNPEQQARIAIDQLLTAAGWSVQDFKAANIHAARGVAIREFPLKPATALPTTCSTSTARPPA